MRFTAQTVAKTNEWTVGNREDLPSSYLLLPGYRTSIVYSAASRWCCRIFSHRNRVMASAPFAPACMIDS